MLGVLDVNDLVDPNFFFSAPALTPDNCEVRRNGDQSRNFSAGHFLLHPLAKPEFPTIDEDVQLLVMIMMLAVFMMMAMVLLVFVRRFRSTLFRILEFFRKFLIT